MDRYSTILKYTRLIVAVSLVVILIISFWYQRIDLDTLLRAVVTLLALNNAVGAYSVHKMNGTGRGQ